MLTQNHLIIAAVSVAALSITEYRVAKLKKAHKAELNDTQAESFSDGWHDAMECAKEQNDPTYTRPSI